MAKEVQPKDTARAMAYEFWMKAPNPMVTFFKTLDVTNLIKVSKRKHMKFNMLLDYCIGKAAVSVKEFYILPVGEKLILMDSGGYVDTGKYKGCGEYDMDYGDPVVLWTPMPEEKDVVTSLPVSYGWNTGNPEAYGTYVAYVFVDGAAKPIIRELLWDGECWYLHGDQIHDDVTVQCWAERPEF